MVEKFPEFVVGLLSKREEKNSNLNSKSSQTSVASKNPPIVKYSILMTLF